MFKQNFINFCNKKGESPSFVCRQVGLAPATFSCWNENSIPRQATLQRIADYFGVTPEDLVGTTPRKKSGVPAAKIAVYGNVAAGIPLEAITDIDDYEEIPADIAENAEYIALRIHGDSMEPRMSEGDVVIVRIQPDVDNGDIAVVMTNGADATCKKIRKTEEGIILVPLNTSYEPIFYSNKQIEELPVRILGKVVELRAKF